MQFAAAAEEREPGGNVEQSVAQSFWFGCGELDIELKPVEEPPEGWVAALVGEYDGLTATLTFRRHGEGGQLGLGLHHSQGPAPVREQLAALDFTRVTTAVGTVTISDIGGTGRPDRQMETQVAPLPEDLLELLTFLENVRCVEEWGGVECELPCTASSSRPATLTSTARCTPVPGCGYAARSGVAAVLTLPPSSAPACSAATGRPNR